MLRLSRGVLLGIINVLFYSMLYSYHEQNIATVGFQRDHEHELLQSGFWSRLEVISSSYPDSYSPSYSLKEAVITAYFDRLAECVKKDSFCFKHFDMSARSLKQLMKTSFDDIVPKLMKIKLSDGHIMLLMKID